ncbi:MAG TPA: ankyrin repeat domain-containing protein [Candidatus Dependentiae bacterium]|nr:ankyrin repeat domain-containing protein [Candidatus Dependentiae bacterium]HRQ63087.1 ankyrin repeat domain-containing protein [Candidatus Dependentiae bacterium]
MKKHLFILILLSVCYSHCMEKVPEQSNLIFSQLYELNKALLAAPSPDEAQTLLDQGACIHARDVNLNTPLHHAALKENISLVSFLLEHNANPNICNHSQEPPLFIALDKGCIDIAQQLITHKARIDAVDRHYNIILHPTAASGNANALTYICNMLQEQHLLSDMINTPNVVGQTPLHIAAQYNYATILRILHAYHANLDIQDNSHKTPLYLAAENGHEESATCLLELGANPDHTKLSPLHITLINHHSAIARQLIIHGANVNAWVAETTPLRCAVEHSRDLVSLLLQYGADPNLGRPIDIVIQCDEINVVQQLAQAGADLDYTLHRAIDYNAQKTIIWLVENQLVDINQRLPEYPYYQPLYIAIRNGNVPIATLLLMYNACVTPINEYLSALRDIRDEATILSMTALLKQRGIDLTHTFTQHNRNTLLHIAAQKGLYKVAQQLVDDGASIIAVNARGFIPYNYVSPQHANYTQLESLLRPPAIFKPASWAVRLVAWLKLSPSDEASEQEQEMSIIIRDDD